MSNYEPNGTKFYDAASNREMLLIRDDGSIWDGWLAYRHPDGQLVSLRKATEDDRRKVSQMTPNPFKNEVRR